MEKVIISIGLAIYFTIAHFFLLTQAKKEWKKQAKLYEAIIQEKAQQINILKSRLNGYDNDLVKRVFGKKEAKTIEKKKCIKCANEINPQSGITEVDKFYCLPCWKEKMTKELIDEIAQEEKPEKESHGLHGIPEVINSLMEAQRKHVERMEK